MEASLGFEIKKGTSVSRIFIPLFPSHLFSSLIKRCRTPNILTFPQLILPHLCFLFTYPRSMSCILNHSFTDTFSSLLSIFSHARPEKSSTLDPEKCLFTQTAELLQRKICLDCQLSCQSTCRFPGGLMLPESSRRRFPSSASLRAHKPITMLMLSRFRGKNRNCLNLLPPLPLQTHLHDFHSIFPDVSVEKFFPF